MLSFVKATSGTARRTSPVSILNQLEASSVERSMLACDTPEWTTHAVLRELVGQQRWREYRARSPQ